MAAKDLKESAPATSSTEGRRSARWTRTNLHDWMESSHARTLADAKSEDASVVNVCEKGTHFLVFETKEGGLSLKMSRDWLRVAQAGDKETRHGLKELMEMKSGFMWAVLLVSGGYFSGGIVEKGKIVQHKCFHLYMPNFKKGGKDRGNHPTSSGLTAEMKIKFKGQIHGILKSWEQPIADCQFVFCYSPGENIGFLSPWITRDDVRYRGISTRMGGANYQELTRVISVLSSVYVFDRCKAELNKESD